MTMNKVLNKLKENLTIDERELLNYLIKELKNFNSVYLLTRRFIDRVDELTSKHLHINNIDDVNRYHFYISIGTKFNILIKETEWSKLNYLDIYKRIILNSGLNKNVIYDKEVEELYSRMPFYYLTLILKITEGETNDK